MCKYILGIYYINICINTIINKRGKKSFAYCLKNSIQYGKQTFRSGMFRPFMGSITNIETYKI